MDLILVDLFVRLFYQIKLLLKVITLIYYINYYFWHILVSFDRQKFSFYPIKFFVLLNYQKKRSVLNDKYRMTLSNFALEKWQFF